MHIPLYEHKKKECKERGTAKVSATLLFPTEEYYGVSAKTIASLPGEEEGFTNFNRILDLVGNTKEIDEDEFAELWANIPQID